MAKKILSCVLAVVLFVSGLVFPVSAEETPKQSVYVRSVYTQFVEPGHYENLIDSDKHMFVQFANLFDDGTNSTLPLEIMSVILDAKMDYRMCAQVLLYSMRMFDAGFTEAMETQSQYDFTNGAADYAFDAIGVATDIFTVFDSSLLSSIAETIGSISVLTKVAVQTGQDIKLILQYSRRFDAHIKFVEAIEEFSRHSELKRAARDIKNVLIEQYTGAMKIASESSFTSFITTYDDLFLGSLTESAIEQVANAELAEVFMDALGLAKGVMNFGVWIANINVGISNMFIHANEMILLTDIAKCLRYAAVSVLGNYGGPEELPDHEMNVFVSYMRMLLYIIGRGEYSFTQLLSSSSGKLSAMANKLSEKLYGYNVYEDYYSRKIDYLSSVYDILDEGILAPSDAEAEATITWYMEPEVFGNLQVIERVRPPYGAEQTQLDTGLVIFEEEGLLGLLDYDGTFVLDPVYSQIAAGYNDQIGFSIDMKNYALDENRTPIEAHVLGTDISNILLWSIPSQTLVEYYGHGPDYRPIELGGSYLVRGLDIAVGEGMPRSDGWYYLDWEEYGQVEFSQAYALVKDGRLITDFIYDDACGFNDGIAAVCQNGKWGYIDGEGNTIIPMEYSSSWLRLGWYENCYAASGGLIVLWKDNEFGMADYNGNIVVPFGYFEEVMPAYNGRFWAKYNGLWGIAQIEVPA